MTRALVVKEFFNRDANRPVSNTEFMEFWKSCSTQEREEFGNSASEQLGIEITQS